MAPVAELHSLWADLGRALEALQAQDDRLTKLHQSVNKVQQSMESAAGRFSRLDKAVAELAQRGALARAPVQLAAEGEVRDLADTAVRAGQEVGHGGRDILPYRQERCR